MNRALGQVRSPAGLPVTRVARLVWEAIWTPFWLGSTLPPPALPSRQGAAPMPGDRTPLILHQLDDLRATIWRQRRAILAWRSGWLAFAAIDCYLFLRVVAHRAPAFPPFLLLAILILVLGGLLIAVVRPTRGQLARTLDRSFGLRERVATALEGAEGGRLAGVRALQVLEATQVARKVSAASAFRARLPVREMALAIVAATLGVALLIALLITRHNAPGGVINNPSGNPGAIPGQQSQSDPSSGQQGQNGQNGQNIQNGAGSNPGQQNPGQGGQPTAQGQSDLDALAGALQDHSATRDAADKLASGDYAGAAQGLRDAGQDAPKLSPEARQGLANDLRDTAGKVSDPQLAQDLKEAANALEQPGAQGAGAALDRIADDIDRIAQGGQPPNGQNGATGNQSSPPGAAGNTPGASPGNGSGGGAGASPQLPGAQRPQPPEGPATAPLGADGKPIQLPKGNANGPQINTQNPNTRGTGTADPGVAGAGGGQLRQGDVGEAGIDPNAVPIDQRGAVEQYFTPRPQGKE